MIKKLTLSLAAASLLTAGPAGANNLGENTAWQFQTTTDMANRAAIEDMRQKRQSGYYSQPVYNTYIESQYNCSVSAVATGNSSTSNAVANSPSTTGNSSSSTGNASSTTVSSGYGSGTSSTSLDQANSGSVSSSSRGDVSTSVRGDNYQTLNTDQTNSGNQTASVTGSTACQYGALN